MWFGGDANPPDESTGRPRAPQTSPAPEVKEPRGLSAPDRQRIQMGLRSAGFNPGPVDGVFGQGTRAAIREWQAARRVPATGYLNADEAEDLIALGESVRVGASERTGEHEALLSTRGSSRQGSEIGAADGAAPEADSESTPSIGVASIEESQEANERPATESLNASSKGVGMAASDRSDEAGEPTWNAQGPGNPGSKTGAARVAASEVGTEGTPLGDAVAIPRGTLPSDGRSSTGELFDLQLPTVPAILAQLEYRNCSSEEGQKCVMLGAELKKDAYVFSVRQPRQPRVRPELRQPIAQ